MQTIQSFTGIINLIGRSHAVQFHGINGLTIKNIDEVDAKIIVAALEALDRDTLQSLIAGKKLQEAPANKARWEPAPDRSRPVPTQTAPTPAPEPVPESNEEASGAVSLPEEGGGSSEAPEPILAPSESSEDATPEDASETVEAAQESSKVKRTRRGRVSADFKRFKGQKVMDKVGWPDGTTDLELKDGTWWKVDSDRLEIGPTEPPVVLVESETTSKPAYDGQEVVKTTPHGDGGKLLVLDNGTRVKLGADGEEVARDSEPAPDLPLEELTPANELPAVEPKNENESGPPQELMDSIKARDLLRWVVANEVEIKDLGDQTPSEADALVARFIELKAQGAKSFAKCTDDESVRKRVEAMSTIEANYA